MATFLELIREMKSQLGNLHSRGVRPSKEKYDAWTVSPIAEAAPWKLQHKQVQKIRQKYKELLKGKYRLAEQSEVAGGSCWKKSSCSQFFSLSPTRCSSEKLRTGQETYDGAGLGRGSSAVKRKVLSSSSFFLVSKSLKPLGKGKQTLWPIRLKEGDQWRSVRCQALFTSQWAGEGSTALAYMA